MSTRSQLSVTELQISKTFIAGKFFAVLMFTAKNRVFLAGGAGLPPMSASRQGGNRTVFEGLLGVWVLYMAWKLL
ncbi:MAG: hypothetical protein PHE55_03005 [Methylococcaceae bacterium]|nr:hypothetical protein [Methylococcaceae bacterium]